MCTKDVSVCAKCGNMGPLTSLCRVKVGQNALANRNLAVGNERNVTESNNTQEEGKIKFGEVRWGEHSQSMIELSVMNARARFHNVKVLRSTELNV